MEQPICNKKGLAGFECDYQTDDRCFHPDATWAGCAVNYEAEQPEISQLVKTCRDVWRQLESLGDKLRSKVPPGHVSYIKKDDAGRWAEALANDLEVAIAKAEKEATKCQK